MSNIKFQWGLWGVVSIALTAYFLHIMLQSDDKTLFSPGAATHGHHQIELACDTCHSDGWSNDDVIQDSCVACHKADLKESHDSHPKSKFTDPRNADRLDVIDARYCAACHIEHNEEVVGSMGVTLPGDFCYRCHESIGDDRESHKDLAFDSCASAGCHNYHDNRALYEDFLVDHAESNDHDNRKWLEKLSAIQKALHEKSDHHEEMSRASAGIAELIGDNELIATQWEHSSHAIGGVGCNDCHLNSQKVWQDVPELSVCGDCHENQQESFGLGKHGMRLAILGNKNLRRSSDGVSEPFDHSVAMQPKLAKLAMKPDSYSKKITCNSCHQAHDYETKQSSVEACLSCHNDDHSNAYKQSKHFELYAQSEGKESKVVSGVSCATCHMPKVLSDEDKFYTNHNQNHNLRPNEKMIRSVCMDCHGVQFSLNALADEALIERNFNGMPTKQVESIEWSLSRLKD